jgi:hypothetical protein
MALAQSEATTSTYVPTIDTIVAQAYRRAGLLSQQQSPTQVQGSLARAALNDLADSLEAEGVFMRSVQYGYVTMATGINQYTMGESVLDIVGNGAYIDPTAGLVPFQATSETPVLKTDRDSWQSLSSKSAQAQPTLYYFARNAPLSTLFVWPTPSVTQNGGQIRFQLHQNRPDVTVGTNTMPFERYWTDYFVWELASRLAMDNSLDLNRIGAMSQKAMALKASAKGYSKQNVTMQASINHPTAWSQRR